MKYILKLILAICFAGFSINAQTALSGDGPAQAPVNSLVINYPNGGQELTIGSTVTIKYYSVYYGRMALELLGGPGNTITILRPCVGGVGDCENTYVTANSYGQYQFRVPSIAPGKYIVRMTIIEPNNTDGNLPAVLSYDDSDGQITIVPESARMYVVGNKDQVWRAGSTQAVEYYNDGCRNYGSIYLGDIADGNNGNWWIGSVNLQDGYGKTNVRIPRYVRPGFYRVNVEGTSESTYSTVVGVSDWIVQVKSPVITPSSEDTVTAGKVFRVKWEGKNRKNVEHFMVYLIGKGPGGVIYLGNASSLRGQISLRIRATLVPKDFSGHLYFQGINESFESDSFMVIGGKKLIESEPLGIKG